MKKTWIIIAAAVIFSLAAVLVMSRVIVYSDETGYHVANRNAAQIFADKDAWNFQNIEIQTDSSNIEFITTNQYGFEFMADSIINTVYTNENGKLTITQSSKDLLFNLNIGSTKDDYIKVYVPERAELKNVKITGKNATITLANLKAENVDITSVNGNITITLVGEKKDYNSNISADGGTLTVDGSVVETYQQENTDAAKSIKINSSSGDVMVDFKAQ